MTCNYISLIVKAHHLCALGLDVNEITLRAIVNANFPLHVLPVQPNAKTSSNQLNLLFRVVGQAPDLAANKAMSPYPTLQRRRGEEHSLFTGPRFSGKPACAFVF